MHQLHRESALVRKAVAEGKLMLVASRYDLHTQAVSVLEP